MHVHLYGNTCVGAVGVLCIYTFFVAVCISVIVWVFGYIVYIVSRSCMYICI